MPARGRDARGAQPANPPSGSPSRKYRCRMSIAMHHPWWVCRSDAATQRYFLAMKRPLIDQDPPGWCSFGDAFAEVLHHEPSTRVTHPTACTSMPNGPPPVLANTPQKSCARSPALDYEAGLSWRGVHVCGEDAELRKILANHKYRPFHGLGRSIRPPGKKTKIDGKKTKHGPKDSYRPPPPLPVNPSLAPPPQNAHPPPHSPHDTSFEFLLRLCTLKADLMCPSRPSSPRQPVFRSVWRRLLTNTDRAPGCLSTHTCPDESPASLSRSTNRPHGATHHLRKGS